MLANPGKMLVVLLVRSYQWGISPFLPPSCRFEPSCSHYMLQSVTHFGMLKGIWLGLKRLARCHPWGGSGYDPVQCPSCLSQK